MIPESEKKLIAPCGLYCGHCNDYIAYINNDTDLKKKTANDINKQLDLNLNHEQIGCAGCLGNIHTDWSARLDCEVRACAIGKKILSCALCNNFSCEKLEKHFRDDNNKRENLLRIKEIGLESWLNEINNRLLFEPIFKYQQGIISSLLLRGFAEVCDKKLKEKIMQYDKESFGNPQTIGACVFISTLHDNPIGLASWDPRKWPEIAEIGWNCILPEFRGKGFGQTQIKELLRRFKTAGFKKAFVRTGEHPFFIPAQKMYLACDFKECKKLPTGDQPGYGTIDYEFCLNKSF